MAKHHVERSLIRILVAAALFIALMSCAVLPIPQDAQGNSDLPAAAFGQPGLYRLEVALLVFYGVLLLVTPAFSGLIRGRLPTEISARGAKFAEEADQSGNATQTAIKKLRQTTSDLAEGLAAAHLEIKELKKKPCSDSAQPKVGSEHD